MTTTASRKNPVITHREIGAAELQIAINTRRGEATPQWIRDIAAARPAAAVSKHVAA